MNRKRSLTVAAALLRSAVPEFFLAPAVVDEQPSARAEQQLEHRLALGA